MDTKGLSGLATKRAFLAAKPQKKVSLLNGIAVPLRPLPLPLKINGSRNFNVGKKSSTKSILPLMARPLPPTP